MLYGACWSVVTSVPAGQDVMARRNANAGTDVRATRDVIANIDVSANRDVIALNEVRGELIKGRGTKVEAPTVHGTSQICLGNPEKMYFKLKL